MVRAAIIVTSRRGALALGHLFGLEPVLLAAPAPLVLRVVLVDAVAPLLYEAVARRADCVPRHGFVSRLVAGVDALLARGRLAQLGLVAIAKASWAVGPIVLVAVLVAVLVLVHLELAPVVVDGLGAGVLAIGEAVDAVVCVCDVGNLGTGRGVLEAVGIPERLADDAEDINCVLV